MPSTGELIDIERVTISSEGGRWKSTRLGNSLAAYPTARPVLNGEDEETGRKVLRLVLTQLECGKTYLRRRSFSSSSVNPAGPMVRSLLWEGAGARTRADGRYSFRLGQGRYVLVAATGQVVPRCPHILVSVISPAPVHADISCDSGIR